MTIHYFFNFWYFFLPFIQDEDVYTFFEPELHPDTVGIPRTRAPDAMKHNTEKRASPKLPSGRSSSKSQAKSQQSGPNLDKKASSSSTRRSSTENISWHVLDLKKENYFSCAVARTRTSARYLLKTSDDVVAFLKEMQEASSQDIRWCFELPVSTQTQSSCLAPFMLTTSLL